MVLSPNARRVLAGLVLLALPACTAVEAAGPAPTRVADAPPRPHPHAAVAISARLDAGSDDRLPEVVGLSADAARDALEAAGARSQLVTLGEEDRVSAQYPAGGARVPPDGMVVVWLGTPPAPPPPPPAAPPVAPPVTEPTTGALAILAAEQPAGMDGSTVASAGGATEPASAPATAEAAEATTSEPPTTPAASPLPTSQPGTAPAPSAAPSPPATPGAPAPGRAAPVRSNIRTLPPATPGTVLEGPASWYGPGFAGNRTACGDTFDPEALTLASRELRCGTRVRITGPTGSTVDATVTDWGPAEWTNRRFDLSAATFRAIHHPGAGVVHVRLEVLDP